MLNAHKGFDFLLGTSSYEQPPTNQRCVTLNSLKTSMPESKGLTGNAQQRAKNVYNTCRARLRPRTLFLVVLFRPASHSGDVDILSMSNSGCPCPLRSSLAVPKVKIELRLIEVGNNRTMIKHSSVSNF